MSLRDNPFTKLFNSLEDAERFVNQRAPRVLQLNEKPVSSVDPKPEEANKSLIAANNVSSHKDFDDFYILENIFLLATESGKGDKLYLLELQNINKEDVREDNLSFLVYERLMASEEVKSILKRQPELESSPSFETDPVKYLTECYARLCDLSGKPFLEQSNSSTDPLSTCFSLIRDQALLLFELPDLLTDFSPINHLWQLLRSSYIDTPETDLQLRFYAHLVEHLSGRGADANRLSEIFHPILEGLLGEVKGYSDFQGSMEVQLFRFPSALFFFSRNSFLASVLLRYDKHLIQKTALPEKSLLGSLLSLGSNPKFFSLLSDYLDDPRSLTQNNISNLEANVHRVCRTLGSTIGVLVVVLFVVVIVIVFVFSFLFTIVAS